MDARAALNRPAVRWTAVVLGGLLALHLLAFLLLFGLQRSHADAVMSGVEVDGVDVGGLDRAGLDGVIDDRAEERLGQTVRVATVPADDVDAPDAVAELETDHASIGTRIDTAAATDDAWARGRRGLWRALGDQLAVRFGRTLQVPLRTELDEHHLDDWSHQAAEELSVTPRDGAIEFVADDDAAGVEVAVTDPRPGTQVDPEDLRDRTRAQAGGRLGPVHVEVPAAHAPPAITSADVEAVLPDAERAVSAPVVLTNPSPIGADLELSPVALAGMLEVRVAAEGDAAEGDAAEVDAPDRDAAADTDAPAGDDGAPEGDRLVLVADRQALVDHLDDDTLEQLDPDPVDAALDLEDGEVVVSDGAPGFTTDLDAAADRVAEVATRDGDGERTDELPGETSEPAVTTDDAEAVSDAAAVLVSAPVVLLNPSDGDDLELSPAQLSRVLDVAVTRDEDDQPTMQVSSSGDALSELLGDDGIAALETSPVELEVALVDGSLSVDGGLPGYAWDPDAAAETVAELARSSDDRNAELPGQTAEPELTAEELEDLGVTEIVSSFTTDLVPGQSRNTNIHLAADYLDGSLVRPGETFSLNQGIGQRTAERGFVENGFIRDGELESVTGGGVSQMGTTFMNAAWFAGVALLDFTPHSFYFSRYPMGREATLSWGTLDVVIENDSPHAIMVLTSHTSSSVTVAFASTPWAEVDTWTGEPYDVVPGAVRNGFTVDFGRDITYPDGSTTSETYTHTYQPED